MNYYQPNGVPMHVFDGGVKKEPFDWSQSFSQANAYIKGEPQGLCGHFSDTIVKQESPHVWSAPNDQPAPADYTLTGYKVASSSNDWSDTLQHLSSVCSNKSWSDNAQQRLTSWNSNDGSWNQDACNGTLFKQEHTWLPPQNYQFDAFSSSWQAHNLSSSNFDGYSGPAPKYLSPPPPPPLIPAPHVFSASMSVASSRCGNLTVLSETSPYFAPQQHCMATQQPVDRSLTADASALRKRKKSRESTSELVESITDMAQVRKKTNRFEGLTEDEVMLKTLPDHLTFGLDIVIIGINPGLTAAHIGHHYAGPGNHFWKCLHLSGLISEPLNAYHDASLMSQGIGFTNMVGRTTKSSAALSRKEMRDGAESLKEKIVKYQPRIAVFNGKGIYEIFSSSKNFIIGKQPEVFPGTTSTIVFVMPSSSARCSQLPRAIDKVPFYVALKKLRDYVRGELVYLDESEVTFPDLDLKIEAKDDQLANS